MTGTAIRSLCGAPVLLRTTRLVASSTLVPAAGRSSRPSSSTSLAAASAISVSGCSTVVSGGPTQRATGRSSNPTTLASSGMRGQFAGGLVQAERLEVVAGEDGRRAVGAAQQVEAQPVAVLVVEVPDSDQLRVHGPCRRLQHRPVSVDARAAAHHPRGPADRADPAVPGGRDGGSPASPPCQLVAPMDGTSSPGSPAGSITANGMDLLVSSAALGLVQPGQDEDHAVRAAGGDLVGPGTARESAAPRSPRGGR